MERDDIFQDDPDDRSPLALDQDVLLDDQFRVGRVLGVGGFGITYLAFDEVLEMGVAVKEFLPNDIAVRKTGSHSVQPLSSGENSDFEFGLKRFLQEARTLAKFEAHPNIVRVRTFFEENGTGYLVMNYYEGRTLAEYLSARNGFIPEEEALLVIEQVLDGLQAVHEKNILHRDIDPSNVYLADNGTVVLLDFGAARAAVGERTQSMSVVLKRGYAPHEQYHSHGDQGPWTDIYACSATLYRALTGYKPPEAAARILDDDLAPPKELVPSLSDATNDAILAGLAVHPGDRPPSVADFVDRLPTPPSTATPGWVGEPTSEEVPGRDTSGTGAELKVTASRPCRLYVDGTEVAELGPDEVYAIGVEAGTHRLRAVRTDQSDTDAATVTTTGSGGPVEGDDRVSLDALVWQRTVSADRDEPTDVTVDFEATPDPSPPDTTTAEDDSTKATVVPDESSPADVADGAARTSTPDDAEGPESEQTMTGAPSPTDGASDAASSPPESEDRPTNAPTAEETTQVAHATLHVETDRPATLSIDGEEREQLQPDAPQKVDVVPGHHVLRAEAAGGDAVWEQDVRAEGDVTLRVPVELRRRSDGADELVPGVSWREAAIGVGGLVLALAVGWWLLRSEAPRPVPGTITVTAETVVNVTANDRSPEGTKLWVQSVSGPPDSVGVAAVVDSAHIRVRPAVGFAGVMAVEYTVADPNGHTASAALTVQVPFDRTRQVISQSVERPQSVQVAPLDTVAGPDVVMAALGTNAISWAPGAPSGTTSFRPARPIGKLEGGAVDVRTADLTGSGRPDLLAASLRGDRVVWYRNEAEGGFGPAQVITSAADGAVAVRPADLNADGDPDVVVSAKLARTVTWHENQGNGTFGNARPVATGIAGLQTLHVTDLDGDGNTDVLVVSYAENVIRRYEAQPVGPDSMRLVKRSPVTTAVEGPIEVHTAELTNDGRPDVLVGTTGEEAVVLLPSRTDTSGTVAFGPPRSLTTDLRTVEQIATGDLDGDGDQDVVAAAFESDAVAWIENQGGETFGPAQPVADAQNPLSVTIADVNGDGTPDVLAAAQADDVVAWYENHLQ